MSKDKVIHFIELESIDELPEVNVKDIEEMKERAIQKEHVENFNRWYELKIYRFKNTIANAEADVLSARGDYEYFRDNLISDLMHGKIPSEFEYRDLASSKGFQKYFVENVIANILKEYKESRAQTT